MNWSDNYSLIGEALAKRYPSAAPMTMKPEEIRNHTTGLPDFAGGDAEPSAQTLAAIGFAWIRAAADDPEEADDRF